MKINKVTITGLDTIIETEKFDKINNCPFCGVEGMVDLKSEIRTHIVKSQVIRGTFYFYKCSSCNESFTTDKSDDISLLNFKK